VGCYETKNRRNNNSSLKFKRTRQHGAQKAKSEAQRKHHQEKFVRTRSVITEVTANRYPPPQSYRALDAKKNIQKINIKGRKYLAVLPPQKIKVFHKSCHCYFIFVVPIRATIQLYDALKIFITFADYLPPLGKLSHEI